MQRAISEVSLGDSTEPTPIARSLVDLPAEIRNLIYHLALVKSEPLDLWPATRCNTIPISEGGYTIGDHNGDGARFRLAIKSMRRGLGVNLLRTCKTISSEATPILYGQNDFRFTMEDGWFSLHTFLTMICNRNRAHVKSISVFVPVESFFYEAQSMMAATYPCYAWSDLKDKEDPRTEQPWCALEAAKGCCELWMEEKTLRTLFLVMPPGLHLDRDAFQIGLFEHFIPVMNAKDELSLDIKLVFDQNTKIGDNSSDFREAIVQVEEELGWETLVWFQGSDKYEVAVLEEVE